MITLFHGSDKIIERPYYGGSRDNNDYGNGFYCSESSDLAREWSVDENRDGFLNCYELDTDSLRVLRLCGGRYSILHWLAILLENRKFQITSKLAREAKRYLLEQFSVPYKDSDILIGYRADDSYFAFANDFLNGTISLRQLEEAMYLGKLGEQVVLKSEESYRHIRFLDYEPVGSLNMSRSMRLYGIPAGKIGIKAQDSVIFSRIGTAGRRESCICRRF